jgi:hypothetical protein
MTEDQKNASLVIETVSGRAAQGKANAPVALTDEDLSLVAGGKVNEYEGQHDAGPRRLK